MTDLTRYRKMAVGSLVCLLLVFGGCGVYYNTFFNAQKAFNSAENARKGSRRSTAGQNEYQKAVEKALKVVENHPNSKYYDDAVYILGVSYYHMNQPAKAEKRFREIIADYPKAKFARDANLYLAKTKLALGELDEAMAIFAQVFDSDYSKDFKAESAMELGSYYHEEKRFQDARRYFMAVRDSLGDKIAAREAQQYIADGYFEMFQFHDALGAYLQMLGLEPDNNQKYHALYRAALCSFRMQRVQDGFDYLDQLIPDQLYFDSLGILKLTMAEGYESDEELPEAEALYEDVASTSEKKSWQAMALYRLGLIQQFDYGQLFRAKEYYDKAVEADRSSPIRGDALMRSSDIGKLKTFTRNQLDSTATQEKIDEAALTQYQLAELFWSKLDRPDSAIAEMQYLVDSFATSYHAPRAMIALAQMIREQEGDSARADSLLKAMLKKYPHSDFVPDGLDALGLKGTAADTGYAGVYINRGENFLLSDESYDSTSVAYQYVVDHFPDSKYYTHARFALIWLKENYASPGDSSIYYAYREFADSFPGDQWAAAALRLTGSAPARVESARRIEQEEEDRQLDTALASIDSDTVDQWAAVQDTISYIDPMLALYRGPGGDTLVDLRLEPIETNIAFEFPPEAAMGQQHDWRLYFQLLIDYSGKVVDYVLKIPSGVDEIDRRVKESVGSMRFDAMAVSNRVVDAGVTDKRTEEGYWFVYQYAVRKPEYLR